MPAKNLKLLSLPALSGLLQFCCFPRVGQEHVAWFALVPLIWFVTRSISLREAFLGGLVSGVFAWFGLLIWIPRTLQHYGGVAESLAWTLYILLVCFLSCFPAAASILTRFCIERGGEKYLLVFPFAWVTLEYLRNYFPFGGFPWLLLGYSQTGSARLIQIADLTGVYGMSFILVWVNAALAWLLLHRVKGAGIWPIAAGLLMVGASAAYGRVVLGNWGRSTASCCTVAMLQENLSFDEPEAVLTRKFQEGYVQMASRLTPESVDLLILPESPSPLTFQYDTSYRDTLKMLARRFRLGMIFNNITYTDGGGEPKYFNSAYFLGRDGQELGRYDKIHLVPFGEYVPLRRLFFFVETISKDVGDFAPGGKHVTVDMGGRRVSSIICFEAVFPELVRHFVREGSELIVNLTNDGWYGDSAAPYQHLSMARWRAVENRRYLLRAANSGISAIIDPTGAVLASTPLLQQAVCEGRFAFRQSLTFYARYGDVAAVLCVIIMIAVFGYNCMLSRKKA
ncbi:MAG TPA: apolipoprotein N-acyltransferase [Acidobacteriota bacterium]|nr:apolipoprotein N-acyltransferase [Acidobacteriota bacterium]